MPNRVLVPWAYAVELLAAGAILAALCMWLETGVVVSFLQSVALDIATMFGAVMLAASTGFLWTFFSKSDTDFYRWLDQKGAFTVYLSATGYSIAISLVCTLFLIALKHVQSQSFALISGYLLLLAIINFYTLIQNVFGLMRLNAKFNQLRERKLR